MDNKLIELSKPVAWIIGEESIEDFKRGYETFVVRGDDVDSTEETMKLYSQEYVSALDGVAQFWIGESAGWKKRAEDAEKRIAELEAKLATPVRLPNKNDAEFWFDGVFQVAKFDRAVERSVSAAGFKFVGDE
ncbi:TPA: hypothetical protein ACKQCE_000541 [Serratia marcescens]